MSNTTNNEPRDYLFIFISPYFGHKSIINDAISFKDAICKRYEEEVADEPSPHLHMDLFKKSLEGVSDNDVKGIMAVYDHFSEDRIFKVYMIDKKVYDREEG